MLLASKLKFPAVAMERVSEVVWLLVTVTTCGLLLCPWITVPKSTFWGDVIIGGTPLPDKPTTWVWVLSLSVTVIAPG